MSLSPEPTPQKYRLKTAQFERLNAAPGTSPASPEHDVFALLAGVRQQEAAAGLNQVQLMPALRRRRRRDYLLLLLAGNSLMLTLFIVEIFLGFQVQCLAARMPNEFYHLLNYALHDGRPMFFLPAVCMTAYSAAITWLMYGVIDRY